MNTAVQNKEMLLSVLLENNQMIKSFGVSKLSIFGSSVTDSLMPGSDIDFLVEFNQKQKSYDNFIELSFYLEDLLGRKVELVTPQSLNKYIGPHILKQAENVAI
jgi:predicted nucleotidyltransferase